MQIISLDTNITVLFKVLFPHNFVSDPSLCYFVLAKEKGTGSFKSLFKEKRLLEFIIESI